VKQSEELALDVGESARGCAVLVDATRVVLEARDTREAGDDGGDDSARDGEYVVDHESTRDEGGQHQNEEAEAEVLDVEAGGEEGVRDTELSCLVVPQLQLDGRLHHLLRAHLALLSGKGRMLEVERVLHFL